MNSGKLLLGVLAGVSAGALLGILFAPDKGTTTRKKISKRGDDYAEELKSTFDTFIDSITDKLDATKNYTDDLFDKRKSNGQEVKNELNIAVKDKV